MVYWQPDIDPGTVILSADLPIAVPPTILPEIDRDATRHDPDGMSLTLNTGTTPLRLLLLDDARPDTPLAALVPLDHTGLDRIEALLRFWQALNGRPVKCDTRLTRQRRRRLRQMLQATDGHLDGATYREIAHALYGEGRVASHPWKTSALRDSTISLVRDGRALIDGGFRTLLRQRRRK